uniref:MADF domain-containing protein n=1 Tax=Stomoxys calcitrans TaxID=35570 RepID=A0A1I8PKQ5_STOCA
MMGTHQDPCTTPPATSGNTSALNKIIRTAQRGGTSESSTTSDNTTDFIEIVKRHDVVYNTHHPDYKNVEVKLKVWTQIAKEIGLSVDASKRKWKNLRDSYTKYLRSFRVGSKTSKKYQFWAHADNMDFLKPYQGPGRSSSVILQKDEEETECDLGFQVLAKATSNSTDEDVKQTSLAGNTNLFASSLANVLPNFMGGAGAGIFTTSPLALTTSSTSGTNGFAPAVPLVLPVPSLPTVQLPPSLTAKPLMGGMTNTSCSTNGGVSTTALSTPVSSIGMSTSNSNTAMIPSSLGSLTTPSSSLASQVFALPQLSAKGPIPMPSSNTASSVGCLIIEPQLFASADTFKKEFGAASSSSTSVSSSSCISSTMNKGQITPSNLSIYSNINAQMAPASAAASTANLLNPPLITKIRRVQPSPHQTPTAAAINLSFSSPAPVVTPASLSLPSSLAYTGPNGFLSTAPNLLPNFGANFVSNLVPASTVTTASNGPSPAKRLKNAEVEISAILQANRDLDANTLFFLSLARSVRSMPTKFQSLAKMRCMRIVSDIEMELDNVNCEGTDMNGHNPNNKYCTNNSDSPPPAIGSHINEPPQSEHFVYVMSPSRVESMIDLSSDDENTQSVNASGSSGVVTGAAAGVGGGPAGSGNGITGTSN